MTSTIAGGGRPDSTDLGHAGRRYGGGVGAFQRYERAVLRLLERHNGRLERRLRTADERAEVHVVSFETRAAYEAYVADPDRLGHRALLDEGSLTQRVLEVSEVAPTPSGV